MKNLGLEFKVGLFTILGLVATGSLFLYLSPDSFDSDESVTYYTLLGNAGGIVEKSHVKTNGVSIGKVSSVDLGTNNTRIQFEVDKKVKIPVGSKLMVKSVGLLGDSHIEIYRAKDTGEYLGDGDLIPESEDGTDLNGLIEVAGKIAQDIKKITAKLSTDENVERIGTIVEDIKAITANVRGIVEENRQNLKDAIAEFRAVGNNVNDLLKQENREKIDRIIAAFDQSMVEVKAATRNINLISERVERGEGTLGKLVNDDAALEELQGAIKDIREVLSPATKLEIAVDAHLEARRDESTQSYFNLVFRTRPDRYYLLGFTDLVEEEETKKVKNIDEECEDEDEGCDSATYTTTERKKALRLNLQFAKRWGFIAARFGLFETTGGLATDFYLLRDRLRFSLEAWDWKTKDNEIRRVAHIKAYASVLFFDHIYLMAGVDDPTKYKEQGKTDKYQDLNYFFGAGLTFNDQDLKALFGAAAISTAL